MRGFLRCERCDWSRIYTRLYVGRLPTFCPACGSRRMVRERNPSESSPAVAHWHAVADQLSSEQARRPEPRG